MGNLYRFDREEGITAMTSSKDGLNKFFQVMSINGAAQLLAMDRQYHFLAACLERPLSVSDLARHCGTHEKPTRLILEGLVVLGLLSEDAQRFVLTDLGKLIAATPQILGNRFWDHLPEYLKTGEPIIKMDELQHQAEHYQAEVGPLGWMLSMAAEEAAKLLEIGTRRKGLRILDMGAGSAVWSLAMLRADLSSRVTALDWPQVLFIAQQQAQKQQLDSRFEILGGDFHQIGLPTGVFDLVILANVTHLETPEGNLDIFRRVHETLSERGEIVVIDVFAGSEQGDLTRIIYQLGLALRTEHGQVYTEEFLAGQFKEAKFKSCELTMLKSPPHILGMLVAGKMTIRKAS